MDSKKKYNLKDVAERAEVSLGTASKVINNIYVSPELRIRVESAMKELHYVPNAIARTLKANKSKTIGVMIPDISSSINGKVLRGIEDAGSNAGYSVLISDSNLSEMTEEKVLSLFQESMVDGIIYVSNTVTPKMEEKMLRSGIPVVFIMTGAKSKGFSSVRLDNEAAAHEIVNYLCECNHERILLLAGEREDNNSGLPRVEGYKRALADHGIPFEEELVMYGGYKMERGFNDIETALAKGLEFTAVFAVADDIALGAMKALNLHGRNVPADVSVAGFDGIPVAQYLTPGLCTIEQPFFQFGVEGTKLLINAIERNKSDVHIRLKWKLLKNDSVKKI